MVILVRLAAVCLRWCGLAFRSTRSVQAENLFLRRQLALYIERGRKPRRMGPATRIARAVWRAADSGFAFDNHARLMLLTGCRAGEWARARWPWVNLKQGLLSIPASEYKTNRPHVVPLVPEAVAILENSFKGGKRLQSTRRCTSTIAGRTCAPASNS
jgi:integrase